ncbi:unnamed protein product, partial [Nesidiocoris tenuis]
MGCELGKLTKSGGGGGGGNSGNGEPPPGRPRCCRSSPPLDGETEILDVGILEGHITCNGTDRCSHVYQPANDWYFCERSIGTKEKNLIK